MNCMKSVIYLQKSQPASIDFQSLILNKLQALHKKSNKKNKKVTVVDHIDKHIAYNAHLFDIMIFCMI